MTWRTKGERYDKRDVWPEYSELSCFACHHALTPAKDSWRQAHGYAERRPGVEDLGEEPEGAGPA